MSVPATQTYLCCTIEPLHIGSRTSAGHQEFRQGVAKDHDGVPLLPATSLKGAIRSFWSQDLAMPGCDGKGRECPQPHVCASCAVFGYVNQHHGEQSSSLLRFSDGRLCLGVFRTIGGGKIWLTTPERLATGGLISSSIQCDLIARQETHPVLLGNRVTEQEADYLRHSLGIEPPGNARGGTDHYLETREWEGRPMLASALQRLVVVEEPAMARAADKFLQASSHVSIDGKTGPARAGSLFEIEAVPPDSLFSFDVSFVDPLSLGVVELLARDLGSGLEVLRPTIDTLDHLLLQAFEKAARLGIGGKRSRGMGRVRIWPIAWRRDEPTTGSLGWPNPTSRPMVFISHSSVNKQIARRLANDLRVGGCRVWLDEHEILVGDSVQRRLGEGIEKADFVVLLISEPAVASSWVRDEIEAALAREKSTTPERIIVLPALVEDLGPERIPTMIRTRRWASLHRNYHLGITELLKSIRLNTHRERSASSM
jgi:CRISPR/Cas system CMR subunit Cmr4 (Cas7 group RAMP superfamily)